MQAALRRFVTARHDKQLRVIVHDAAAIASAGAPLLALAQRLPSVIQFREVSDPVDRALVSACLLNDAGDFYFRLIGHRLDGEAGVAAGTFAAVRAAIAAGLGPFARLQRTARARHLSRHR